MKQYDDTNRGAIWPNKKRDKETSPHFTGSLNVEGVEYWVSAWKRKEGASENAPSLSFAINMKQDKRDFGPRNEQPVQAGQAVDFDDEIPF